MEILTILNTVAIIGILIKVVIHKPDIYVGPPGPVGPKGDRGIDCEDFCKNYEVK